MPDEFPFTFADTSVPPWMQTKKICEVDLRPVRGASLGSSCTWGNTQGQPLPIGDHEACWSAWPRIPPGVGWTEDAQEVWANKRSAESGTSASWDWEVEVPVCTGPPRVQLLPRPKQLRPRGSVALVQQRRVEQHQKDSKKEDGELWQQPDDADATATMLRRWSSIRPGVADRVWEYRVNNQPIRGSSVGASVNISGAPVAKPIVSPSRTSMVTLVKPSASAVRF